MDHNGYFTLGHWRGLPIRIHWSAPVSALVFSRFEFAPVFWLGFALLILIHEIGHALMVRWCGATVISVDLDGLGGSCAWTGEVTPIQRALIAWSGVFAQIVLLLATYSYVAVMGPPASLSGTELYSVFTYSNLWMVAFNLIPLRPLDGAEAWPLIPLWYAALRRQFDKRQHTRIKRVQQRRPQRLDQIDIDDDFPPTPEVEALVKDVTERLRRKDAPTEEK
jgi:Zn-dependent protease